MNQKTNIELNTALHIASYRDNLNLIKFLINKGLDPLTENSYKLNTLDYSVIYGNYLLSRYLIEECEIELKPLEFYFKKNRQLNGPLFNVELFYEKLKEKCSVEELPNFGLRSEYLKGIGIINNQ